MSTLSTGFALYMRHRVAVATANITIPKTRLMMASGDMLDRRDESEVCVNGADEDGK